MQFLVISTQSISSLKHNMLTILCAILFVNTSFAQFDIPETPKSQTELVLLKNDRILHRQISNSETEQIVKLSNRTLEKRLNLASADFPLLITK